MLLYAPNENIFFSADESEMSILLSLLIYLNRIFQEKVRLFTLNDVATVNIFEIKWKQQKKIEENDQKRIRLYSFFLLFVWMVVLIIKRKKKSIFSSNLHVKLPWIAFRRTRLNGPRTNTILYLRTWKERICKSMSSNLDTN